MTDEPKGRPPGLLSGLLARLPGWSGPQGATLRLVLALGLVGVLLLYVADMLSPGGAPAGRPAAGVSAPEAPAGSVNSGVRPGANPDGSSPLVSHEQRLARELELVLGAVAGTGRVRVTVRLTGSPAQVLATENRKTSRSIREQDAGGGTRTTIDGDESVRPVVLSVDGRGDQPLTVREEAPGIAAVVVVAEGARNARVREDLYRAAAAATGAPLHRITVLPMEGGT